MALSARTRQVITIALGDNAAGKELADKIDSPATLSLRTQKVIENFFGDRKAAIDFCTIVGIGLGITVLSYLKHRLTVALCDIRAANDIYTELSS